MSTRAEEPVAWMFKDDGDVIINCDRGLMEKWIRNRCLKQGVEIRDIPLAPLYTHPPSEGETP